MSWMFNKWATPAVWCQWVTTHSLMWVFFGKILKTFSQTWKCPLLHLYQTLSDFLGRKRVLYLTIPFPHPQHLAEGLPWAGVRGGLMDWYLVLVPYLYLVYWVKDCSSIDWYLYKVHQRYNRYISNAGGRDGIFSQRVVTSPSLNRQVFWNRFSNPPNSRALHLGTENAPPLF